MSTYLGAYGRVALRRKSSEGEKLSVVNASDINVSRRRFSFDFETGFLISGDQVEITSTDGSTLDFVGTDGWANNTKQTSGKWYVFVDDLGGIRLYNNFAASLDGELNAAITLDSIASDIPIRVKVENASTRLLGAVTSYEVNTNREAIDVTALSEEFRSQYSGLMSGSGTISCHWDYLDTVAETGNYLLQLILRTEVGSEFDAELFVKVNEYSPTGNQEELNDRIYYSISGIITNAAVAFQPGSIVEVTADFVTTGPIRLKVGLGQLNYLLQENGDRLELEQDSSSYLLLEQED
jgi:hypothetical protein